MTNGAEEAAFSLRILLDTFVRLPLDDGEMPLNTFSDYLCRNPH